MRIKTLFTMYLCFSNFIFSQQEFLEKKDMLIEKYKLLPASQEIGRIETLEKLVLELLLNAKDFADFNFTITQLIELATKAENHMVLAHGYLLKGFSFTQIDHTKAISYFNKVLDIALGICILILIVNYILKIRKQSQIISVQKRKVQEALDHHLVIATELNHRMKSNLQIISSVITLSEINIINTNFKRLLQNIQSRIESITLLHKELTLSKEFELIDLKYYISKVICNSYEDP